MAQVQFDTAAQLLARAAAVCRLGSNTGVESGAHLANCPPVISGGGGMWEAAGRSEDGREGSSEPVRRDTDTQSISDRPKQSASPRNFEEEKFYISRKSNI